MHERSSETGIFHTQRPPSRRSFFDLEQLPFVDSIVSLTSIFSLPYLELVN